MIKLLYTCFVVIIISTILVCIPSRWYKRWNWRTVGAWGIMLSFGTLCTTGLGWILYQIIKDVLK